MRDMMRACSEWLAADGIIKVRVGRTDRARDDHARARGGGGGCGKDVNSLAVNPRDTELVVGGADCAVTIYDVASGRMLWRFSTLATVWAVSVSEVVLPRYSPRYYYLLRWR